MKGDDEPVKCCKRCGKEMRREDWIQKYTQHPERAKNFWRFRVYCSIECSNADHLNRLIDYVNKKKEMKKNKIIAFAKMIGGNPVGIIPQEAAEKKYVPDVIRGDDEFNIQVIRPEKYFWLRRHRKRFDGQKALRRVLVLAISDNFKSLADSFLVLDSSTDVPHIYKLVKVEDF